MVQGERGFMDTQYLRVLIPARDEQDLLPAALQAVRISAQHAAEYLASLPTGPSALDARITVVADLCADDTAAVAADIADEVLISHAGSAGGARREGMRHIARTAPPATWLMCTDADSLVPPAWISAHLRLHHAGADAVSGAVTVIDWSTRPEALQRKYEQIYEAEPVHVHGANLGVSLPAYRAVGGFAAVSSGEDQDLVDRLLAEGFDVQSCRCTPVATSSRRLSRAPRGFAEHLNMLEATL